MKKRDYSMIKRDDLPIVKDDHVRKLIMGDLEIDRSCFIKSPEEKQKLKTLKRFHKYGLSQNMDAERANKSV